MPDPVEVDLARLTTTTNLVTGPLGELPSSRNISKAIARHYNLYENACLQTGVTEMRVADSGKWEGINAELHSN